MDKADVIWTSHFDVLFIEWMDWVSIDVYGSALVISISIMAAAKYYVSLSVYPLWMWYRIWYPNPYACVNIVSALNFE